MVRLCLFIEVWDEGVDDKCTSYLHLRVICSTFGERRAICSTFKKFQVEG